MSINEYSTAVGIFRAGGSDAKRAGTAVHEAAHAVSRIANRFPLKYATIEPDVVERDDVRFDSDPTVADVADILDQIDFNVDGGQAVRSSLMGLKSALADLEGARLSSNGNRTYFRPASLDAIRQIGGYAIAQRGALDKAIKVSSLTSRDRRLIVALLGAPIRMIRMIKRAGHVRGGRGRPSKGLLEEKDASERRIVVLLAGMHAKRKLGAMDWEQSGSLDLQKVWKELLRFAETEREVQLRLLETRVGAEVDRNWNAIGHVADMLLKKTKVFGDEIRRSLKRAHMSPVESKGFAPIE
jgi:hypothetical protein